jgi:Fuc2NAc and GlcNAc transferase
VRFLVHLAAAALAIALLGGLPSLDLGAVRLPLGVAGSVIGVLGIVWLVNLYNFMDGIDGIAGGEALTTGAFGGVPLLAGGHGGLAAAAFLVAAASAGFLAWNWHPARIFMGDVGSGLLGYLFAVLAVASERAGAVPLLAWMVLLGVFVVDATITLFRRMLRGEKWYDSHRTHAYQRAVQAGASHARVSGAVLAINAVLAALAAWGCLAPRLLPAAVVLALLFLVGLYLGVERVRPFPPAVARASSSS